MSTPSLAGDQKPDPGSKNQRRKAFDRAGKALVRRHNRRMANPEDPEAAAAFQEAAREILRCARDLPDDPERHADGSKYRAGESSETSISIQLFGTVYAYQNDTDNLPLINRLIYLAVTYFKTRNGGIEEQTDLARRAERDARREKERKGRPPRRTGPLAWQQNQQKNLGREGAMMPRSHGGR